MIALFRTALLAALTCVPSVAVAQTVVIDSLRHRIDSLEHRTSALEHRVNVLEAMIQAQPVPTSVASPSLANWRRLSRGMKADEVRTLLGEPESVNSSSYETIWRYPEFGYVTFRSKKLDGWSEPHQ